MSKWIFKVLEMSSLFFTALIAWCITFPIHKSLALPSVTQKLPADTYAFTHSRNTEPWPVWLSCLKHRPIHQNVAGSIPSQSIFLGCMFDPHLGSLWEATNRCFSSSLMFLFLFLSLALSHALSTPAPSLPLTSPSLPPFLLFLKQWKKCPEVRIRKFFLRNTENLTVF